MTPGEAVKRMTPQNNKVSANNDNARNDLIKHVPVVTPPPKPVANDVKPVVQTKARRNQRVIDDAISAMNNLGLAKRKAKALVNQCYDTFKQPPNLQSLITRCLQAGAPS